jgi:hypothetical protein
MTRVQSCRRPAVSATSNCRPMIQRTAPMARPATRSGGAITFPCARRVPSGRLAHRAQLPHDKFMRQNHSRAAPPINPTKKLPLFEVPISPSGPTASRAGGGWSFATDCCPPRGDQTRVSLAAQNADSSVSKSTLICAAGSALMVSTELISGDRGAR